MDKFNSIDNALCFVDGNIVGSVTDENLREWAKALAEVVYESDEMERDKGEIVYHLIKKWDAARKRINSKHRIVHNRILAARYQNLYTFFCETTIEVNAIFTDTRDEASAILRRCAKEPQAFSEPQQ